MTAEAGVRPGRLRIWFMAIRPATLTASVVPVFVGSCAAAASGHFRLALFVETLLAAMLIQIGSNLANDYFDFRYGKDTAARLGPPRVTQTGLMSPGTVRGATIVTLTVAILIGIPVVMAGGWTLVIVGLLCVGAAVLYTGGPWPLGYHGLGDLAAFLFFGPVAVAGTAFVQSGTITAGTVVQSLPVGFIVCAILVVNNLRDIETDRAVNKRTLAVYIGRPATRIEFLLLLVGAYCIPLVNLAGRHNWWALLPWLTLPLAASLVRAIWRDEGRKLNLSLVGTAQLNLFFGVLLGLSLIV